MKRWVLAFLLAPFLVHARTGLVVLQFDDGKLTQYAEAFPILERYGLSGSFAIVAGSIGGAGRMTVPQVQDLYVHGHEIHDHTRNHAPAFWGDPVNAPAWRGMIQRSLDTLAAWGIDGVRGWNQPGGPGQGFSPELRDTLALFYDYSAGRVGLNYLQNKNNHWNFRDDPLSLGRGGVYSWGYNAPAASLAETGFSIQSEQDVDRLLSLPSVSIPRSAQAEVHEILKRMADGLVQGLVVIPVFHDVAQSDSSAWGLEEICRAVIAWGVPVLRAADAFDAVTAPGYRWYNLAPNPDLTIDRNQDGIVDGWVDAGIGGSVENYATSTVYGPEIGETMVAFTVSSATTDTARLGLTYYHLNDGAYTTTTQSLWFTARQAPVHKTFSVDVVPDVDRVQIQFMDVDASLMVSDLQWILALLTPVAITGLAASLHSDGVALSWQIVADEAFDGFHVYRSRLGGREIRVTPSLLPATARSFVDRTAVPGNRYGYVLVAVGAQGSEVRSEGAEIELAPLVAALCQNTPNPFNPSTTIRFVVPAGGRVTIDVFGPSGLKVRTLVSATYASGEWSTSWDGTDHAGNPVASGVYYYRMHIGNFTQARKMLLLK